MALVLSATFRMAVCVRCADPDIPVLAVTGCEEGAYS